MDTSKSIKSHLEYLQVVIRGRLTEHFTPGTTFDLKSVRLPADANDHSPLQSFIRENKLSETEIIILLTALAPHVDPIFFDDLIQKHIPGQGDFPQFGGIRGRNHRGFLPTAETILFILAGNDLKKRFEYQALFDKDHPLATLNLVSIEEPIPGEPQFSGRLILAPEYVEWFITGMMPHPKFSMDFPAEYITTELTNEDLVLSQATLKQITELENWVNYHDTLMNKWNMKRWIKPGYRALFHGPPGTGKTLTALIVGKNTKRDVFRIDLSMVVSKFIGETEKNLSQLLKERRTKIGSCSSTRRMPFSANGPTSGMHMINMQTRRWPTYCSASKTITA